MTTKSLLSVLNKDVHSPPPIWFMRQAGRYLPEYRYIRSSYEDFMRLCYTPKAACEVTLQPIHRFNFDAAIIFSDILVIPDALGQKVSFKKDHGPVLDTVRWTQFLKQAPDGSTFKNHLEPVYEALRMVKSKLPEKVALIGFAGAPWTLATYMIEQGKTTTFATALTWLERDCSFFESLMRLLEKAVIEHLCAQIEAGADVVQLFDSWAKMVPNRFIDKALTRPVRTIIQGVHERHPTVPIIYFCKERCDLYPLILRGLSNVAAGIDQFADLDWVEQTLCPDFTVQGNLCPHVLAEGGLILTKKVDFILEKLTKKPFIFNLGHGILPHTPIDHVHHVIDQVRAYKKH